MSLPVFTKVGRLSREVELKYTASGVAIANTSIVFSEKYKEKEDVCFIDLVAFGKTGELLNQYFSKGDRIAISGKINQSQWEDKDGNKRSKHSVTIETFDFIESNNGGANKQDYKSNQQQNPPQQSNNGEANHQKTMPFGDEEIPF